jgi:predicted ATP-grasp superfamily ATP-dependent carboligase
VGAVQHGQLVEVHPDTGAIFSELQVPHWDNILDLAARCVEMTGLGYLGVDIVLDRNFGPMLLELNARPGLAIQVANQSGLRHRLAIALKISEQTDDHDTKIALAKEHFGGQ